MSYFRGTALDQRGNRLQMTVSLDTRFIQEGDADTAYLLAYTSDGSLVYIPAAGIGSGGSSGTSDVDPATIDHDALLNFVANEHVDHTGVTLTAGVGLSGGGDISASRTFDLDITELTVGTTDIGADYLVFYDTSLAVHRKVLITDLGLGGASGLSYPRVMSAVHLCG